MVQVTYFKYTKKKTGVGKRIFRMAPLHHHFELGGWSETRVVAVFAIVTALLCMLASVSYTHLDVYKRQTTQLIQKAD